MPLAHRVIVNYEEALKFVRLLLLARLAAGHSVKHHCSDNAAVSECAEDLVSVTQQTLRDLRICQEFQQRRAEEMQRFHTYHKEVKDYQTLCSKKVRIEQRLEAAQGPESDNLEQELGMLSQHLIESEARLTQYATTW